MTHTRTRTEVKTLLMTVGLPRSGKSTWSRRQRGIPIVNPDSIRLSIHGKLFEPKMEPLVWFTAHRMVEALFLAGHNIVILDATNVTLKRRMEWLGQTWKVIHVMFRATKEECIARTFEDNPSLVPVIERMAAEYEEPVCDPTEKMESQWDYPDLP